MSIKRDTELLFEIGTLRFIDRTWRQFLTPEFASLSDHILRVVWTALIIANREKVKNTEKVLKMALVHDIGESRTGDANGLQKQYISRDEKKAVSHVLRGTAVEKEMYQLYEEYEERKCIEAKIVKDADIIDQFLELREQEFRGNSLNKMWDEVMDKSYASKLFTSTAKEILAEIKTSNPLSWYMNDKKIG